MTSVTLPTTTIEQGRTWKLYTFDYETADGKFCGYLYAISMEHAAALLEELKQTATLCGEMIGSE